MTPAIQQYNQAIDYSLRLDGIPITPPLLTSRCHRNFVVCCFPCDVHVTQTWQWNLTRTDKHFFSLCTGVWVCRKYDSWRYQIRKRSFGCNLRLLLACLLTHETNNPRFHSTFGRAFLAGVTARAKYKRGPRSEECLRIKERANDFTVVGIVAENATILKNL